MNIPLLMGILNITDDSFADGGRYLDPELAFKHAKDMIAEGADIIDLGAESTRPGSKPVSQEVEIERLQPLLKAIHQDYPQLQISVDSQKSAVAQMAIDCGASIINDISALRYDPDMASVIADKPQIKVILMHMKGNPATMQKNPSYIDVVAEVQDFFLERLEFCRNSGIAENQIWLDPGIGFGKNLQHNLSLLTQLDALTQLGYPVVLGASRKRFINTIIACEPQDRLPGTLAVALAGAMQNIQVLRVHDVAAHKQFLTVFQKLQLESG